MERNRAQGRILTFYSYKGGTGRSMALANIAWILACNGRRVLAIDWDLEAPGLHRYFRPFLIDEELSASDGLIDLVDEYANQVIRPVEGGAQPPPDWYLEYADFSNYVVSLNFKHFPRGGKIDFLPSGRQGDRYAMAVSSFNWQNFYDRLGGGGFFDAVKANARAQYDYVLIDSRTGVSDTAGICSVQMPDSLVVCFTYNNQSIKGAAAVARSSAVARRRLIDEKAASRRADPATNGGPTIEDTPSAYRVFPIPMRVDPGESDRLTIRRAYARDVFADLAAHIGPSAIDEYWGGVEVPHSPFYSYEEVLAPFKEEPSDPKSILGAFVRMTRYLTDGDVAGYSLPIAPSEKQEYLDAFAETPLTIRARQAVAARREESEEEALVRKANAALNSLTEAEAAAARRVFSRLVRLGSADEGGGYFPILSRVGDFSEADRPVIAKLADHQLLAISSGGRFSTPEGLAADRSVQTVGLADDRLLRGWKTLREWLDADRPFLLWRQQLRTYLRDWERSGREAGALLGGRLLSEADLWSLTRSADLNSDELEYVAESRQHSSSQPTPSVERTGSTAARSEVGYSGGVLRNEPEARSSAGYAKRVVGQTTLAIIVVAIGLFVTLTRGGIPSPSPTPTPDTRPVVVLLTPTPEDATPLAAEQRAKEIEDRLTRGDGYFANGNTTAALEAYAEALALDPGNQRAFEGLRRAKSADQSKEGRVAIHFSDASDAALVEEVRSTLSTNLQPITFDPPRRVTQRTTGDVRYFYQDDRGLAERVKSATVFILSNRDVKLPMTLLYRDAKRFPDVRPGTIEVWLPALVQKRGVSLRESAAPTPMPQKRPSAG